MSGNNEGIIGPDSLRLGGKSINQLSFVEAEQTKGQLPEFFATEKLNKLARIKTRYPKQSVDWCEGAIRECQNNMKNVRQLKTQTENSITEYKIFISQCRRRDRKIMEAKLDKDLILAIKKEFPPYQVKPMKTQVGQFKATINRCDDVIAKEVESIAEIRKLLEQVKYRDQLLKEVEAT